GGISSAFVMQNLDGMARYLSSGGPLMETVGRFCQSIVYTYLTSRDERADNTIQYTYLTSSGESAGSATTPTNALISEIIDSWGNPTTFTYCDLLNNGCTAGQVTVTLPDGRTTSFVVVENTQITQITSPSGMVTALTWIDSPCEHGEKLISSMTSA